jgi:Zn-dependent protease with chaperone function
VHPFAVALLVLTAVVMALLVPRVLPRFTSLRRTPAPALLLWHAVGLSAVAAALLAAPVEAVGLGHGRPVLLVTAGVVTATMLAWLLLTAHRVGTDLRRLRREHRDLVDLLDAGSPLTGPEPTVRVLDHANPTAYCLPGRRGRIVLSTRTLSELQPDELAALIAHERAHLRARHDLLLEFFSVLHRTMPGPARSDRALAEVQLLVEALADRRAMREVSPTSLARALVAIHSAGRPDVALGVRAVPAQTRVRLELIADAATPRPVQAVSLVTTALVIALVPWILTALAL